MFRCAVYRFLTYALFIATTFTIAGSETAIILMMILALGDSGLWRWLRTGRPPADSPYLASPPGWIPGVFLLLVAAGLLSALINPATGETLDHMRFHYRVFLPLVLLLALPQVDLRSLLGTFAGFVALWGLYGAIQYRFGVDWFRMEGNKIIRPYGSESGVFHAHGEFTHHITYGGVMLMATVLLTALATGRTGAQPARTGAARPGRGITGLWALGAVLGGIGTVLSLARSAWLGMGVGLVVLGLLRLPRRWSITLAVGAALLVAAYSALAIQATWLESHLSGPDSPALLLRLARTSPVYDVDRVRMWQAGWLGVKDRPWFGAGMGNAAALEPYRQKVSEQYGYRYMLEAGAGVHDIYLQVAFDLGAVGLAAYLAVWIAIFVWAARSLRALGPGLSSARLPDAGLYRSVLHGSVGGLAGAMVAGLFENNAYDKEVQQLMLMLMGLVLFVGLRVVAGRAVARRHQGGTWVAMLWPNYAGIRAGSPLE